MSRKPQHLVQSPKVWMALISPVRAEILEALRLLGPCTIAEVAQTLGRPADSLYRHFEILQKAGVVVDAGFRKGSRNVEQLFDLVADDIAIDFHDGTGAKENQAVVATANSFLKAMNRAVRDSAAARQLEFGPERRNFSINYELSWLTPEDFQKVRELMSQIKTIMDKGKTNPQGRLYLTLTAATPVTRKRGVGSRSAASASSQSASNKKPTSKTKST